MRGHPPRVRQPSAAPRLAWLAGLLLLAATAGALVGACDGIRITRDPLVANLTPSEAEACRQAVRNELLSRNVPPSWVSEVRYVPRYAHVQGSSNRITGYNAWVYPRHGNGALVVELSEACRVTDVWSRGLR